MQWWTDRGVSVVANIVLNKQFQDFAYPTKIPDNLQHLQVTIKLFHRLSEQIFAIFGNFQTFRTLLP